MFVRDQIVSILGGTERQVLILSLSVCTVLADFIYKDLLTSPLKFGAARGFEWRRKRQGEPAASTEQLTNSRA